MIYSALISVTHPSNQMFQYLKQRPILTGQNLQRFYQYVAKELTEIAFTAQDIQNDKQMNLTAISYLLQKVIELVGKQFISQQQYLDALEQKKQMEQQQKQVVNYKIRETKRVQNETTYGLQTKQQVTKQQSTNNISKSHIPTKQLSKTQINQQKQDNNLISDDVDYLKYQLKYMENLYNKNQFLLKLINNRIGDIQNSINKGIDILKDYEQENSSNVILSRNIEQLMQLNQFDELYDLDMIDKQYEEYLYQLEQRKLQIKTDAKEQYLRNLEEQKQNNEQQVEIV